MISAIQYLVRISFCFIYTGIIMSILRHNLLPLFFFTPEIINREILFRIKGEDELENYANSA